MKFRVFYEVGNDRCTEIVEAETPGDAAKIIQEREGVPVQKVKRAEEKPPFQVNQKPTLRAEHVEEDYDEPQRA